MWLAITEQQAPQGEGTGGVLCIGGMRDARPNCGARGRRLAAHPWSATTPPPAKFRMQFDWVKIQQGIKTLQFQRSDFRI